jgi:hypothetical protein
LPKYYYRFDFEKVSKEKAKGLDEEVKRIMVEVFYKSGYPVNSIFNLQSSGSGLANDIQEA